MSQARRMSSLAIAGAVLLAACGSGAASETPSHQPSPATSAPPSNPTPATTADPGTAYSTRAFSPALDMRVPSWLPAAPGEDSLHFVTFILADGTRGIRIMNPVSIFKPGESAPSDVPADYAAYLDGLAANGIDLTDRETRSVDGHDATILTVRAPTTFEGSVGCPAPNLPADSCFGFGEAVVLRIAAVNTDAGPLLIWLRLPASPAPDMASETPGFEAFLDSIRFADRQPEATQAAVVTKFDGTYTWTITKEDAIAGGQAIPAADEPTYPWVFTVQLEAGTVRTDVAYAVGSPEHYVAAYTVAGDELTYHAGGLSETWSVVQDPDGTLHLTPVGVTDPGDTFVNTTKPWVRQP